MHEGVKVLTLSDSSGFIHDPDGIDSDKLNWLKELKFTKRGRVSEYTSQYPNSNFYEGKKPWGMKADLAFPCATQNELEKIDAKELIANGIKLVAEGANMPCTLEAAREFQCAGVLFAPAKAANAGGVAVSGLEQTQNALRLPWTREEVDNRLQQIMENIHRQCVEYGSEHGEKVNYVKGANIAGFAKVADAMLAYGIA